MSWHAKARQIIAKHCEQSYRAANFKNKIRSRKHVPYRVPEIAEALIRALNSDDEHEAKRLFIIESTRTHSLI